MLQVMDGATQTVSTIVDRMKELAAQANSDNIGNQRDKLDAEFGQLRSEIQRIVDTTKYQGSALVDGNFGNSVDSDPTVSTALGVVGVKDIALSGAKAGTYELTSDGTDVTASVTISGTTYTQTIADAAGEGTLSFGSLGLEIKTNGGYEVDSLDGMEIEVTAGSSGGSFMVSSSGAYGGNDLVTLDNVNLGTGSTGLNLNGLDLTSAANAQTALGRLDTAIGNIADAIGTIGAAQSRFDYASTNVATMLQNTQAAESTIRDADMAYEMTQFTKSNILQQAAQSMLSQANQGTQGILQLLRG
jgi:flagellin